jgi:WD40 repeat protein
VKITGGAGICFSPNGDYLATSTGSNEVLIWNLSSRQVVAYLAEFAAPVNAITFSPDGCYFAVGTHGGEFGVWDVSTWVRISTIDLRHGPYERGKAYFLVDMLKFGPNKTLVCLVGSLKVWDWEKGVELLDIKEITTFHEVRFPESMKVAVSLSFEGVLEEWDMTSGKKLRALDLGPQRHIAISPKGDKLIIGGGGKPISIMDYESWSDERAIKDSNCHMYSLFVSPDGKMIIGPSYSQIRFWNMERGEKLKSVDRLSSSFDISPDGKRLASSGRFVRVWDLEKMLEN